MTDLLEKAISLQEACTNAQLKTLPTTEQDAIATLILEEITDDAQWEVSFAKSPDVLAKLAVAAMAEYHASRGDREATKLAV